MAQTEFNNANINRLYNVNGPMYGGPADTRRSSCLPSDLDSDIEREALEFGITPSKLIRFLIKTAYCYRGYWGRLAMNPGAIKAAIDKVGLEEPNIELLLSA